MKRPSPFTPTGDYRNSLSTNSERIRDAVDVVEPRRDQRDLENRPIVEACATQPLMVFRRDPRSILGELHDVVEHHTLGIRDRRGLVVRLQRFDEIVVKRDPTQKLCVRVNSILASVLRRHHRRDHLVLAARERKIRRHQRPECRECVIQRIRDETVRLDDRRRLAIRDGVNRSCVLDGIQILLHLIRAAKSFVGIGDRNGFDPGHDFVQGGGTRGAASVVVAGFAVG